jgi:hypothetical protein
MNDPKGADEVYYFWHLKETAETHNLNIEAL